MSHQFVAQSHCSIATIVLIGYANLMAFIVIEQRQIECTGNVPCRKLAWTACIDERCAGFYARNEFINVSGFQHGLNAVAVEQITESTENTSLFLATARSGV